MDYLTNNAWVDIVQTAMVVSARRAEVPAALLQLQGAAPDVEVGTV